MGEEGCAVVLPSERQRAHGRRPLQFYDKVPTKYAGMTADQLKATGVRGASSSGAPWQFPGQRT